MRVEVSGYQFEFPPLCACCYKAPDSFYTVSASKTTGTKVQRTQTNTWNFPYCAHCLAHISTSASAGYALLGMGLATLLLAFLIGYTTLWLGIAFAIAGTILTLYVLVCKWETRLKRCAVIRAFL